MIDFLHEYIALQAFTDRLSSSSFTDPTTRTAQSQALAALTSEGGSGLLGALLHQWIAHSASDGKEIALLQRASHLWAGGIDLCAQLGSVRADFEASLENPNDPGAPARFNQAGIGFQTLSNTATGMLAEIDALRRDVLKFSHLPAHPRQHDLATRSWDWSNLTAARRTDALVRSVFKGTSSPSTLAFANGAAASYGANVVGSAYLGHAVGGPRRNHRFRDRIARNTVGNWLALHHPGTPLPTQLADRITFGPKANPTVPSELMSLVQNALSKTFDLAQTEALPDLQVGYSRLIKHLQLLDAFSIPPVPTAPAQFWLAQIYGDPQNIQLSLRPQNVDVNAQDGGGAQVSGTFGTPGPGHADPDSSDSSKTARGCGILLLLIILADLVQAFVQCIGQWSNKHKCTFWDNMLLKKAWQQDPPSPTDPSGSQSPGVTASRLTGISGSPEVSSLVGQLFNVHCQAWEAMSAAYVFLSVSGLVYPRHLITGPLYAQFTSLPPGNPWPHREEASPLDTYHLYPTSPLEDPSTTPSPFGVGADPNAALSSPAGDSFDPGLVSMALWRQIAAGEQDSENRDLDGDRGMAHPCWAAKKSVHDEPIDVLILQYTDQ